VPANSPDRWFYSPPASPAKKLQKLDFQRFITGDKTAREHILFPRAKRRNNSHSPQPFLCNRTKSS
jgi:hypothetical protein